jgi:hypothetical protein
MMVSGRSTERHHFLPQALPEGTRYLWILGKP